MARADLILGLVRAAGQHDDVAFKRTVEAMIAEERVKHHHLLADRLEDALRTNGNGRTNGAPAPGLLEPGPGIDLITPQRTLPSLVLPQTARAACEELVEEQERVELLRAHGLEPRHRVLLTGPPGNGKTSLAEAVAEALYLPLVRVRYEMVVGSFLGETGARLAKVFDFARTRRCLLFLDEFDAIAKERGDAHETGEIKRVVSSLLLLVDELPSHVVLFAASNHPELLDRAAHRRFEIHLALPIPTHAQRAAFFESFLATLHGSPGYTPRRLADATENASFSLLEDLTLDIRRRHVLHPERDLRHLIEQRVRRLTQDLS
ncbi:MAG: ATP-binding protein [Actinomycetota bacterium]|nr:ATP-binding protein [Actinomycetota bacterium]